MKVKDEKLILVGLDPETAQIASLTQVTFLKYI